MCVCVCVCVCVYIYGLIELDRSSGILVSNIGDSGYSLLFSSFTEKEFSFPHLGRMLGMKFFFAFDILDKRICSFFKLKEFLSVTGLVRVFCLIAHF